MILNTPKEMAIRKLLKFRKAIGFRNMCRLLVFRTLSPVIVKPTLKSLQSFARRVEDRQWRAIA